jgi:RNase P subunit RPR2
MSIGRHGSCLDSRTVTRVALIPACEECRKLWLPGDDERWRAYWIDDGPEERLLFYCHDCSEREFFWAGA